MLWLDQNIPTTQGRHVQRRQDRLHLAGLIDKTLARPTRLHVSDIVYNRHILCREVRLVAAAVLVHSVPRSLSTSLQDRYVGTMALRIEIDCTGSIFQLIGRVSHVCQGTLGHIP